MRKLLLLLLFLLLPSNLWAGSIYTSGKAAIAALKGCATTAPCELLDYQYVRAMLVNGYTYSAAHDFVNDVQSFEVTDDASTPIASRHGYYIPGYPSWSRLKLTTRTATSSIFDADDLWWPHLTNVTFDGIILFYYDRNCDLVAGAAATAAACRTGATHPLIAYFPVAPAKTVTNQGLLVQWSNTTSLRIINYANADSGVWTATDPTVIPVVADTVTLADCSGCTVSGLSAPIVSGNANVWKRYVPTTAGGITLSDGNFPSSLQYVIIDGLNIEGRQISTFPADLGNLETNGCDFCLFANMKVQADFRTDRGLVFPGRACWNGEDFNVDCPKNGGEDGASDGTGVSWPGGNTSSSTASSHVAYLNDVFTGYRQVSGQAANNVFFLDTLVANMFDGSVGWNTEYAVVFRSAWFITPNHGMTFKALPVREMTWHCQDTVFAQQQDWITSDDKLGVNGSEEMFIWHSVFANGVDRPNEVSENNSSRLNRNRQLFVALDNVWTWGKDDRMIGKITRNLANTGAVLADYNVFKYEDDEFTQPISIYDPVSENNEPTNASQATWIRLDATNKGRITFVAQRNRSTGDFYVLWLTDRSSGTSVAGGIEARLETDNAGSPSGTAIFSVTDLSSTFATASTTHVFGGQLTTPIVQGATYHLIIAPNAAYQADYTLSGGTRYVALVSTIAATSNTNMTAYTWNGASWDAVANKLGYSVGTDESYFTVGAWTYGSHNILHTGPTTPIFAAMPTFTVPAPTLANFANSWGFVIPNTLGTVRSWFQPRVGSPMINAASDGTNIGLSGGGSEPTDPEDPPPPVENTAPNNVSAGADQTIESGASANITCVGTDDGLPAPPAAITYAWAKVSGAGTVTFVDATSATTSATFSIDNGDYVLSCTVSDSLLTTTDNMSVHVNDDPAGDNTPPVVSVGADTTATLGGSLSMVGVISDDGLIGPLSVRWTVLGPNSDRAWKAPSGIPYIRNQAGSDASMSAAYKINQSAGVSDPVDFDLRSAVDPSNSHSMAFKAVGGLGTFVFFGSASNPAYTSQGVASPSVAGPTVAVTPPSGMTTGDLVVLFGLYRNSSVTLDMSENGGQSWTCGTQLANTGDALTTRLCYAIYDGTWDADPSMTVTAGVDAMIVRMVVFTPSPGAVVSVDVAEVQTQGQGADPLTVGGLTTLTNGSVIVSFAADQDDNRWNVTATNQANFSPSDQVSTILTFPSVGTYTVTLTVNDGLLETSDDRLVVVEPTEVIGEPKRPPRGRGIGRR